MFPRFVYSKQHHNLSELRTKYFFAFVVLAFLTCGCVDESFAPDSSNVTVHLYDHNAFPGNIEVSRLSIGFYPQHIPDGKGVTHLLAHVFPYSLRYYFETWGGNTNFFVFDGVLKNNVIIVPLNDYSVNNLNYGGIFVNYPMLPIHSQGYLKFISKELFEDYGRVRLEDSSASIYLWVSFPAYKSSVEGKIVFLQYSHSNGNTYFDKYGEKDVILNNGNNQEIYFTEDDIKFNPPEDFIYFQINIPGEYSFDNYHEACISFDNYNPSSDFMIIHSFSSSTGGLFTVPGGLLSSYKVKILDRFYVSGHSFASQEKWTYCYPGSSIVLDNSAQPHLYQPLNGSTVFDSSVFCFGSQLQGIYYMNFMRIKNDEENKQTYITRKENMTFDQLKNNGFVFNPNTEYYWWVEQPSGFNSVDEFLSAPYVLNPHYTSKICSEVRIFKTAP